MTNKLRGEVEIELAGEKWPLRPTFEALSNIESKLDKSIPEVVRDQRQGKIRFAAVTTILWEGMVAANEGRPPISRTRGGKVLRYEDVGEMVVQDGLVKVVSQEGVILFLLHGVAGGQAVQNAREVEEQASKEAANPTVRAE